MYSYVSALGILNERNSRWTDVDLQNVPFSHIFQHYKDVIVHLSNPHISEVVHIRLAFFIDKQVAVSQTINQWLVSNGSNTIDATPGVVELNPKTVMYKDAVQADFTLRPVKMGTHHDIDWPLDVARDLLMMKDNVDYHDMYNHCLVTVNGLLHRTSFSVNGLYVVDGAYSRTLCNDVNVGVLNFKDVGELEFVNLRSDMLFSPKLDNKLYNRAYIKSPVPLTDKVVLLSLGGYLHVLDNVYRVIGDNTLVIDFNNLPLLERYFESSKVIDLSSLQLSQSVRNKDQVIVDELIANEDTIRRYIDLSQSFLILVDTPSFYKTLHLLQPGVTTGSFVTPLLPKWPLRTLNGKLMEYYSRQDNELFMLHCTSYFIPNYQFSTTDWQELDSVSNSAVPFEPVIRDRGFFLEMGRDF